MEQRLIDAKALIDTFETKKAKAHEKSIKHLYGQNKNDKLYRKDCETESRCEYVLSVLRTTPTVDAVPVVHGYDTSGGMSLFRCSVCGWFCWDTYCGDTDTYNYCPNCGAKMKGANDEAD